VNIEIILFITVKHSTATYLSFRCISHFKTRASFHCKYIFDVFESILHDFPIHAHVNVSASRYWQSNHFYLLTIIMPCCLSSMLNIDTIIPVARTQVYRYLAEVCAKCNNKLASWTSHWPVVFAIRPCELKIVCYYPVKHMVHSPERST
jgi:hypothetical protein